MSYIYLICSSSFISIYKLHTHLIFDQWTKSWNVTLTWLLSKLSHHMGFSFVELLMTSIISHFSHPATPKHSKSSYWTGYIEILEGPWLRFIWTTKGRLQVYWPIPSVWIQYKECVFLLLFLGKHKKCVCTFYNFFTLGWQIYRGQGLALFCFYWYIQ